MPSADKDVGQQELESGTATLWASQVMLVVKNPPANAGDVRDVGSIPGSGRSPGGSMATHSSILAWRIPWTEEPDGLQSMGLQRVRHDLVTKTHTHIIIIIILEKLILKLKLQYCGHLRQRADSLKKTLIPRKARGK